MEDEILALLRLMSPLFLLGLEGGAELAAERIAEALSLAQDIPVGTLQPVIDFTTDSPATRLALSQQENLMRTMLEKEFRALVDVIQEGIFAGEGADSIANRVKDLLGVSKIRAQRIARTETMRALNHGDFLETQANPIVIGYEWSTILDGRQRDSHSNVNGERIVKGGMFSNGLRFPLDPNGSAEEVVNCRCLTLDILRGEDV